MYSRVPSLSLMADNLDNLDLSSENDRLQKKVELLQEELAVLRSLFSNVGVLPDHIHRELSRQMDSFQQQHNAMGAM